MPDIIATNPLAVQFDVRPTFDKFLLSDVNGVDGIYVAASIPAAGVVGNYTITGPDGTVIYNNTSFASPDYDGSVSYLTETVPTPKNADGTYVTGTYTIVQRTQITDGVAPVYVLTYTGTYNFQYVRPVISIEQTVDCISPLFTSTDTTTYSLTGQTAIDNTRIHSVIYPPGSAGDGSPIVGASTTITTSTFYNGPQTTTISSDVVWTFNTSSGSVGSFEVRDLLAGVKYVTVDCSFICSISCCLRSLYNTKEGYRGTDNVQFARYSALFSEVMAIVQLALVSISCGSANDVSDYLIKIQTIANCTDDCCGSDTPSLVVGLGGSGVNIEVVSGGSPVVVSANTVGDTTTYTITLDQSFIDIVNNSYNTIVTSADSSITVSASGSNPKTYDLSVNLPDPSPSTFCSFVAAITYSTVGAGPSPIAIIEVVNGGDSTSVPVITDVSGGVSIINIFRVSGFNFGSPLMATKFFHTLANGLGTYGEVVLQTVGASYFEFSIASTQSTPHFIPTNGVMRSEFFGSPINIKFLLTR